MSLADQASLLLIPSGYKSQKVYSIFPTDGDGDFDFSRSGSATRIAKNGLITTVDSNIPRLEYPMIDGVQKGCPSLILEPQRTNSLTYSEDFENYFNISEITLNPNYAVSPDGTINANKVTFPFASRSMYKNSLSLSGTHSISFWYKGEGSNIGKTFNVRLALGATVQNIKVTLESGWKRFEAQNNGLQVFEITNRNNTTIGTGSLLLYGFQTEQGSYSTSYIPTNGTAVTRQAETCNGAGDAATFNDSEGVLMAEISSFVGLDDFRLLTLNSGNINNIILLGIRDSGNLYCAITDGGVNQFTHISDYSPINIPTKLLVKYKTNDISFWINGFKLATDTSATIPTGLNQLDFNYGNGAYPFYGNTKQVQYYNSALTDSELEQLTSWTSFTDMAEGQLYTIE